MIESNPYQRRNTVNSEIILRLNLKLVSMMLKISNKESLSESEIKEIKKLQEEILTLAKNRTLSNDIDLGFLKKEIVKV